MLICMSFFFFFNQKTAYEMRISDWSSDVCSSDLEMLTDDWIPIRPGMDHAMILGMIHTLLVEDDPQTNPLIDWDFLHRCTVGFDADHMPEGCDTNENLMDYVLGKEDGLPRDAEWAARKSVV